MPIRLHGSHFPLLERTNQQPQSFDKTKLKSISQNKRVCQKDLQIGKIIKLCETATIFNSHWVSLGKAFFRIYFPEKVK